MSSFEMPTVQMTKDEMLKYVARLDEMQPSKAAFVDTVLPGYERETFTVIGMGVTENSEVKPAIPTAGGFNVTYIRSKPGARSGLHAHPTVEVFIPMSGKWAFIWGDEAEFDNEDNEIILGPGDVISVPPGVMRCFRNVGTEEQLLLVIFGLEVGSKDGGKVMWPKSLLEECAKLGMARDEHGALIRS